jgi:hypothetical protein
MCRYKSPFAETRATIDIDFVESGDIEASTKLRLMVLLLAATVTGLRRLTAARAKDAEELLFEEEYPVDLVSLNLR